jgi:hypothetical protein
MTKRKICFWAMLTLTCLFYLAPVVSAQEMKSGEINWVKGYISAVGNGTADPSGNNVKDRLKALRAAELIAQRTLLETLKGVQIDSRTTVENFMLKEDVINSRVEGIVKGAQIVKRDVTWEKDIPQATVEMRICLSNNVGGCKMDSSLMTVLNIDPKSEPPYAPPDQMTLQNVPLLALPDTSKKQVAYDSSKPVSGVIFNLQGQPFERQLLPIIITVTGENKQLTVYSVKYVTPKVIRSYGVVRYADNEDQAKGNAYIGNNAVIIPVDNITKENMIVITPDAARILRETTMHGNDYLAEAKVVISSN